MKSSEYNILWPDEGSASVDSGKPNYNAFISGLLSNPSTTKEDRERIVDLLLKGKDKDLVTENQVRSIIEQYGFATIEQVHDMIEQKGEVPDSSGTGTGSRPRNIFFHNPKNTVSFLYQFSKNDDFKWYTHDPEQPDFVFNYEKYKKKAEKGFKRISFGINQSTWRNVRNFVFNTEKAAKDFNNEEIKIRWKDLEKWCDEHKLQHPYNTLIDNYKFSKYIDVFKNTIEFRNVPKFSDRIEDFISDVALNSPDVKAVFTDAFYSIGGQLRVFVDVRQLFFAIKEMCKWIVENRSKGNRVEVSVEEKPDSYVLSLFHINSYMNIDHEKLKGLSGEFIKVRNILLNVADWYIDADVNNESLHIVCLDDKTEYVNEVVVNDKTKYVNNEVKSCNQISPLAYKVNGVKYSIVLYKNTQQ